MHSPMLSFGQQAGRFAAIGLVGFVVDAGLMTMLHQATNLSLIQSRLGSFSVAVSVTWYLNRRLTFADRRDNRPLSEWGRFAAVNGAGALINLGIFLWLIGRFAPMAEQPVLALALAATVALLFNFIFSRQLAFRGSTS